MDIKEPKPREGEDNLFHYNFESYMDFICWFAEHAICYRDIQTVDIGLTKVVQ